MQRLEGNTEDQIANQRIDNGKEYISQKTKSNFLAR